MELKNKKLIEKYVESYSEKIKKIAQWLFEHPEPALKEYEGAKMLSDFMEEEGFRVERNYLGMETAWKAVKKNGEKGPKIALLAEFDALPGCGHACGHHMIAAMSVGAGCVLAEMLNNFEGEIAVFGTPAEETGDGKTYLADRNAFDDYDFAIMLHPYFETIVCPDMIAIGGKDFVFKGKAAHAGADPWNGINALDAAVLFYNAIGVLRQQMKDRTRIHGIMMEGGKAPNVIPDYSRIRLEWRAPLQKDFDDMTDKIQKCAEGAALATGCQLESEWFEPICNGLRNDPVLETIVKEVMDECNVEYSDSETGGSSDVGNVSQIIPTLSPMFGVTQEKNYGMHTPEFRDATMLPFGQERMLLGVKILALTGLTVFENPGLLKELREERKTLAKIK